MDKASYNQLQLLKNEGIAKLIKHLKLKVKFKNVGKVGAMFLYCYI